MFLMLQIAVGIVVGYILLGLLPLLIPLAIAIGGLAILFVALFYSAAFLWEIFTTVPGMIILSIFILLIIAGSFGEWIESYYKEKLDELNSKKVLNRMWFHFQLKHYVHRFLIGLVVFLMLLGVGILVVLGLNQDYLINVGFSLFLMIASGVIGFYFYFDTTIQTSEANWPHLFLEFNAVPRGGNIVFYDGHWIIFNDVKIENGAQIEVYNWKTYKWESDSIVCVEKIYRLEKMAIPLSPFLAIRAQMELTP